MFIKRKHLESAHWSYIDFLKKSLFIFQIPSLLPSIVVFLLLHIYRELHLCPFHGKILYFRITLENLWQCGSLTNNLILFHLAARTLFTKLKMKLETTIPVSLLSLFMVKALFRMSLVFFLNISSQWQIVIIF